MKFALLSVLSIAALIGSPPAFAEKCHADLSIFYEPNATSLSAQQRSELQLLVERFRQNTRVEAIVFVGHADSSESSAEELHRLAIQRAELARNFLARVYPELGPNIYAEGKGASQPESATQPERNRRTELMLVCSTRSMPG